jgi:hypothetical protein
VRDLHHFRRLRQVAAQLAGRGQRHLAAEGLELDLGQALRRRRRGGEGIRDRLPVELRRGCHLVGQLAPTPGCVVAPEVWPLVQTYAKPFDITASLTK